MAGEFGDFSAASGLPASREPVEPMPTADLDAALVRGWEELAGILEDPDGNYPPGTPSGGQVAAAILYLFDDRYGRIGELLQERVNPQ